MNERIKELVVRAGIYDCEPNDPHLEVDEEYIKLVELVVRECANVAFDVGASAARVNRMERYRGCTDAGKLIKQHFGVEE